MSAPLLLTATQAAELLNVSERYLATLLERGALPVHDMEGERRVKLGDLLTYKRTRDAERADALREMADEAQRSSPMTRTCCTSWTTPSRARRRTASTRRPGGPWPGRRGGCSSRRLFTALGIAETLGDEGAAAHVRALLAQAGGRLRGTPTRGLSTGDARTQLVERQQPARDGEHELFARDLVGRHVEPYAEPRGEVLGDEGGQPVPRAGDRPRAAGQDEEERRGLVLWMALGQLGGFVERGCEPDVIAGGGHP